jgi:hypothetical protein
MPYEELDLTGMDFDTVEREFAVLKANFGEGYGAGALVGSSAGLHHWTLSSGCLPADDDRGSPIDGQPRFDYYWDFFQARMAEADGIFIIDFRGKKYHASFVDTKISMDVFTFDLFGGGVAIRQRRVAGITYESDGSVDLTPPTPPTSLSITDVTDTEVEITFTPGTG